MKFNTVAVCARGTLLSWHCISHGDFVERTAALGRNREVPTDTGRFHSATSRAARLYACRYFKEEEEEEEERERERENGKRTMLSVVMVVLPSRFA